MALQISLHYLTLSCLLGSVPQAICTCPLPVTSPLVFTIHLDSHMGPKSPSHSL